MKRLFLALVAIGVLLLAGCPAVAPSGIAPGEKHPASVNPSPTTQVTYEGNQETPILPTGIGVASKVEFDGVYPGWSDTVLLTIVNGQDKDRLLKLKVVSATNPLEGYEAFPQRYFYWINISQPSVTVLKGGNFQVPITVTMPKDSDYNGKKVEVWIRVEDTTQTGLVRIAVESRWFIITAD